MAETIQHAVLTAVGADRPGLVDEVARYIAQRGGNLEDSRMVNLHGQFAMMMLVGGTPEVIRELGADLHVLAAESNVHAELTATGGGPAGAAMAMPYRLSAWSIDHPGLVQSVAHVLREHAVNIESAETSLNAAPVTGAPLFSMEFVISVPAETSPAALRAALGAVCDELNIDWQLSPV
jgi:glycine cleavage system transcriptional repressor